MRTKHLVFSAGLLAVITSGCFLAGAGHLGPANLYPNSRISPGLIATTDANELTRTDSKCGTYSKCHRKTTEAMKAQVAKEYGQTSCGEIDHIVPLALGGADDLRNLWCQPVDNEWNGQNWGKQTKDKLEAYLVIQVKNGSVKPQDAQQCIIKDWVACYEHYFGSTPNFGGVAPLDPDDL